MKIHLLIAAAFLPLIPSTSFAQLKPEQTLNRRPISEVRFSPNAERVAFTVSEPAKGTTRSRHVWILDVGTRESRRFTNSAKSEFAPRWSPDGRRFAFLSDREETTQIYLLPPDGGDAIRLTEGKNSVRAFEWSPDGKQIAFLASEPKGEAQEKKEKDKDDARVVDRDDKPARLWLIDVESKKVRQLTAGSWQIQEAKWTPQGDRLIISTTDHPEVDQDNNRIFSVATADGQMKEIAAPRGPFGQLSISPDGSSVAYLAARLDGPSPHDLYLQPLAGGPARNLTAGSIDRPIANVAWRANGTILALAVNGFHTQFYVITPDGKAVAQSEFKVNPGSFDAAKDVVAFAGETTTDAPEVWLSTPAGTAEAVTHLNESWKQIALIKPEFLRYKSFDGTEIEAAVLKPAGYQAGTKVPLIVLVHGGPTGRWADSFQSWGQLLAARGYAVVYPNVRGSTGYGHSFLEKNRADWGGGDFKDVMAGVDFLIARGLADPDRLGIAGWSYGGYMASWAITQTNRFKAAMTGAGLSDLASEFGTEDGSSYDEWFFGTPYEKPQEFIDSSPITFIKNARTPTLILQGEADVTDPMGQSQQLYRGLKRYNVETQFVLYPREGHGFREEKHQVDVLNRIVEWFDSHLRK
ncbi:MAG TPA: S9 family peptidase [Pyrinomonadaceae bacterium]|jgi:dipeptidyl aminopeptidase/acylaminoacyl peptidase|nr:S9 family peptidase [Pyrinomonadaceae bacterium]